MANWAKREIIPLIGTPLSGYGDRNGKPSTGTHDKLYVKVLCLSDGMDTVAIAGSDLLLVPENVAALVREQVSAATDLEADDILFNASHTHSGPGAWGPGFVGEQFAGEYDQAIVKLLAKRLGVAPSAIAIVGGEMSRKKKVRVLGLQAIDLVERLGLGGIA